MHYGKVTKTIEHEKFGKREVEFTVPQCDTLEELEQFYGGATELLSRNNKIIARSAPQGGVLRLKSSDAADLEAYEQQIAKEQEASKNYKPEVSTGPSVKAKAEAVDKLAALASQDRSAFESMSAADVLKALGIEIPAA